MVISWQAWKHFLQGTAEELFDPNLMLQNYYNSSFKSEVHRVIHIGLLCTQEAPSLRPTMSTALRMLAKKEETLPAPTNPPFVDETTMEFNDTMENPRPHLRNGDADSNASMTFSSFQPRWHFHELLGIHQRNKRVSGIKIREPDWLEHWFCLQYIVNRLIIQMKSYILAKWCEGLIICQEEILLPQRWRVFCFKILLLQLDFFANFCLFVCIVSIIQWAAVSLDNILEFWFLSCKAPYFVSLRFNKLLSINPKN